MPVYYLRNSKAPDGKIVPITVSLNLEVWWPSPVVTGTAFPDVQDPEGEEIWVLTVSTSELDGDGNKIPIEVVNVLSLDTVHEEIQAAMGRIGQQIDWGTLRVDDVSPQLKSLGPSIAQTENVPITSNVIARIIDPLPAAGLDLTTLNMNVNGLPVVISGAAAPPNDVEFRGNAFDKTIIFRPKRIL